MDSGRIRQLAGRLRDATHGKKTVVIFGRHAVSDQSGYDYYEDKVPLVGNCAGFIRLGSELILATLGQAGAGRGLRRLKVELEGVVAGDEDPVFFHTQDVRRPDLNDGADRPGGPDMSHRSLRSLAVRVLGWTVGFLVILCGVIGAIIRLNGGPPGG